MNRLVAVLGAGLGDGLMSLSVHGSWVAGDFCPGRSDLDFLAVLAHDPDEETLSLLASIHASLDSAAPHWVGRVEVDYVSPAAVEAVVGDVAADHTMARISPGEPIHLVPASRHYLLNWQSACRHDHALLGRLPSELLPRIPPETVRAVVLDHARRWPEWVRGARAPGFQAYAVLSMCRALAFVSTGEQLSKRAAAARGRDVMPEREELITWADDWWYGGGRDDAAERSADVAAFIGDAANRRPDQRLSAERARP